MLSNAGIREFYFVPVCVLVCRAIASLEFSGAVVSRQTWSSVRQSCGIAIERATARGICTRKVRRSARRRLTSALCLEFDYSSHDFRTPLTIEEGGATSCSEAQVTDHVQSTELLTIINEECTAEIIMVEERAEMAPWS